MSKTWQENAGQLALRAGLGGVLVAHGVQKLFGWLGGHGLTGTAPLSNRWVSGRANKAHSPQDWVRQAAVSSSRSVSPRPQPARRPQAR